MARERTAVEAAEDKLERLHARLTDAVENLVTGNDWARALEFAARFRSRSFNNTVLIWMQHLAAFEQGRVPESTPTYVAGFRQWLSLGRSVDRGQAGYMIFAPVLGRFASPDPDVAESWRRLQPREAPRPGDVLRTRLVGIRPAYVWDASQTSGEPIPEMPRPQLLEGEAPEGLWDGLAALVVGRGYTLRIVASEQDLGGANGMTNYLARSVAVRGDMDPAGRAKTLAHELAHIALHGPDNPAATLHRGVAEVEAESVALMIGAAHGLDTSGYTIPYVSTWATSVEGKTPVEVVQATGERVRAAAVAILDGLPTTQMSAGDPPGLSRTARSGELPREAARSVARTDAFGSATPQRPPRRPQTSAPVL